MDLHKLNKYQTPITEELQKSLPKEVWEDLLDFVGSVRFIQNLIAPEEVRGFAKDRPRDSKGRIKVDLTNPHIIEDMDYFRERALFFERNKCYTHLRPNPNPRSEFAEFWKEEKRRWKEGFVRPSDGEWIPGYYYFYLNYTQIWLNEIVEDNGVKKKTERVKKFPKPWLGDYLFFHYYQQAIDNGNHVKILKTRGVGISFKFSALSPCNMYINPGLPNFHLASDKTFLEGDKGVFGKIVDNLDWIGTETPFPRLRLINRLSDMEVQLGYQDEFGRRRGLKSSVFGISLKDNPDKARGVRGPLIHYEEDGLFKNLEKAWNVNRKAVEDGDNVFGVLAAAGTGGTVGADFVGSEKLFRNPKAYNIYGIPNVFDKNSDGKTDCGFFWPAYLNRANCYDEHLGEPDVIKALLEVLRDRFLVKYNSSDPLAITQKKAEEPCVVGSTLISNYSIGSGRINTFDSKFCNGVKNVYDFLLESGRKITCTDNHKVFNGIDYKPASAYKVGDAVQLKPLIPNNEYQIVKIKGNFTFDDYNIVIDEDWGRFLGFYMGDGSFHANSLKIDFDIQDVESIEWIKKFCTEKFGRFSERNYKDKNQISILVHNVHLLPLFKQMDLLEKTSTKGGYKRRIYTPDYIFNSPKSVIKEYLSGYFDADSGIYTDLKNIKVHCKYRIQLESVQYLLSAFDIYPQIKSVLQKGGTNKHQYLGNSIVLRSWEVDRFKNIGYISKRKQEKLIKWTNYTSKTPDNYNKDSFKSLTYIGEQEVFDIQTKEECYSANGVWVHNCTPAEAVMKTSGTLFPVSDLKEYLGDIKMQGIKFHQHHYVGELVLSGGTVKWQIDNNKSPIRSYQVTGNNLEGAIEIFEMPKVGADKTPFRNRYIGGIDPVDDDQGTSLCSIFIFDLWTDTIVAEYTGRPKFADDFYEICRRLLMFYNAEGLYENNKKGLFSYFQTHGALYLLAENPSYLKDREMMKKGSYGNKAIGVHATKEINELARRLQRDWMLTIAHQDYQDVNEEGNIISSKMNLQLIRSIGYIDEAVEWSIDGNFDRVSAMGMVMILREEKKRFLDTYKTQADPVKDTLNSEYFSKNYKSKGSRF